LIVLNRHAWGWWVGNAELLSGSARKRIDEAVQSRSVYVSSISAREVALLAAKGRLQLTMDVATDLRAHGGGKSDRQRGPNEVVKTTTLFQKSLDMGCTIEEPIVEEFPPGITSNAVLEEFRRQAASWLIRSCCPSFGVCGHRDDRVALRPPVQPVSALL